MKRLLILLCAPLLFLVMFAAPAFASGQHFTHGGVPTCTITPIVTATDTSQSVTCSGELAGLGNVDLVLDLSTSGFALYACTVITAFARTVPSAGVVMLSCTCALSQPGCRFARSCASVKSVRPVGRMAEMPDCVAGRPMRRMCGRVRWSTS